MARFLAAESREAGLAVPAFRSPPRVPGVARTIRRLGDGAVVAIQIRGREADAVAADMVDGIVLTNRLEPSVAEPMRRRLLDAVLPKEIDLTATGPVARPSRRKPPAPARLDRRQTQAA
jgi:hypothetical protein